MLADPGRWERYYEGDADEQRIARRFSYSDRMRYYLPAPGDRGRRGPPAREPRRAPASPIR